jgi:hypothetical protein
VDDYIGVIGAGLAYLVAGIHLTHPKLGFPRLVLLAQFQSLEILSNDPRPFVFVVSGIAIILAVPLAATDRFRKAIYALGFLLILSYIVGYFAWHLSGHGGFLPGRQPLYHGMTPLEAVVAHLSGDLRAGISKLAEFALLTILIVLYRREK